MPDRCGLHSRAQCMPTGCRQQQPGRQEKITPRSMETGQTFFVVIVPMPPVDIYPSYTFEKINEEQLPPKPNELDNTCRMGSFRKKTVSGTKGSRTIGD